jgi:hypothetical protein
MLDLAIEPVLAQQLIQSIVEGVPRRPHDRAARNPQSLLTLLLLALSHGHAIILRIASGKHHPGPTITAGC